MLGFFPDPYPDELFYSICGRFYDRVQYPDKKQFIKTLFGTSNALAVVDLPAYFNTLLSNIPSGHLYTVDSLINNHTLLPFYSPFHPPERITSVRESMRGSYKASATEKLGLMANSVPSSDVLQFCPLCVEEDKQQFGECYWHRVHQVPGVKVCPKHKIFLESSNIEIHNQQTRHQFISAEQSVYVTSPRCLDLCSSSNLILLEIARDTSWLLNQSFLVPGLDSFRNRYLLLLADRELATYQGRIYVSRLLDSFKLRYPSELLNQLHCQINTQSQHNWLFRLVRSPKNAQHPLHHLLLIHFLGHTAESFFQLPTEFKPFGNGQWSCLNPVCQQFRQHRIKKYSLSFSQDSGKPIGTFSCRCCGFVYSRIGPDQCQDDAYRYSRVESYGSLWESRLQQLWEDPLISLREVARQLDVDCRTVKLHAERLKLSFPYANSKSVYDLNLNQFSKSVRNEARSQIELENKRAAWLSLREANPDAGGKILRSQSPSLYTWLYRNDKHWLQVNMPPRRKSFSPSRVDGDKRDRDLAKAAKIAAETLKTRAGKPIQITTSKIGREIHQLTNLQKNLDKLPLTSKVLAEVVETREAFAVRRISYAAEYFRKEGIYPQRWQLIRQSGLRPEIENLPKIQEAISSALALLNPIG